MALRFASQQLTLFSGIVLSEYTVEDKKQVADFDPNAWIEDNQEEEEASPCPICLRSDQEDVLLLCDGCDAPYHTHCVELDRVPNGEWFCMECASDGAYARAREPNQTARRGQSYSGRNQPRTQASVRRTRQRLRTDQWVGIWGLIGNRIHDAVGLDLDLDFSDDDQHMGNYRTAQRRTPEERREFQRWQQRLSIASRQGAGEIFQRTAPMPREQRRQTPEMSPEESLAWGALERAKEMDSPNAISNPRKRKSRSATGSPAEPERKEPERKLKRPRTRIARPPTVTNASSSSRQPLASPNSLAGVRAGSQARPLVDTSGEPSFLSSLLREVETATSDDDSSRAFFSATAHQDPSRVTSPSLGYSSSPGASPSPSSSAYHTPRAMSATPPPTNNMKRPGSPLPLTSRIEPNYSPSSPPVTLREQSPGPALELRQPTPRRNPAVPRARSLETSPARASMSIEAKEGINKIVKSALAPHWKSGEITKDQYAEVNRDVSRKLYDLVADGNREMDDDKNNKWTWKKVASQEVAIAIKSLTA